MDDRIFVFGPFSYDARRKLLIKKGAIVSIGQRALAILEALLEAHGQTVSKSKLMDAVWKSENIEESNLTVQIAALRKCLGYAKNGEEWIATTQRVGYRFVNHDEVDNAVSAATRPTAALSANDKPSIAVLPFLNLSSDVEQEYFADGLAEDLITDLSHVPGLVVIARHSSFSYRGKALDLRQIANELGVRYVVEGSVRRSADHVRITAQLIDASANTQLWAQRFDRELTQVFELQDDVVAQIIQALSSVLPLATVPQRRRAPNLEAYDLFVRGRLLSMQSAEDNATARPLLERACALDSDFAEAHAWLAMNLLFGWMYCYQEDSRAKVLELAPRAVALDPTNSDARVILGYVLVFNGSGDLEGGRQQFERALSLNPNHADALIFLADLEVLEGRAADAVVTGQKAFQLNPHPPPYYQWLYSWMLYGAGRYQDVVDLFQSNEDLAIGSQRNLAAALAQLGRVDEARKIVHKFMAAVPQFTIKSWINTLPFRSAGDKQRFIDGYLKAGFPLS